MNILEMLTFPFMQRALIAGVLVSLCAAPFCKKQYLRLHR